MPQYIMQIITAPVWIIEVRRVLKITLSFAIVKMNRYCILSPDPHTELKIAFQVLLISLTGYYVKLFFPYTLILIKFKSIPNSNI